MNRPVFRPAPLALAIALAIGSPLVHAQSVQALLNAPVQLNMVAQPLGQALNDWARQTRIELIAPPALVAGKSAPAISGQLTPRQALDRLLAGSGLVATLDGAAMVIRPVSTVSEATLAPVVVAASADRSGTTEGTGSYTSSAAGAGTRMDLSLRETPQSVSVIGRQQIEDQNLINLDDVLRQTPGIVADRNDERVTFSSRGFPLNTMIDGVPTLGFNSVAGEASMISAAGTLRGRFVAARSDGRSFIQNKKRAEDALYGILEADLTPGTVLSVGYEHQKTAIDGANYGQSPLFFSNGTRTHLPRSFNSSAPWSYWDMFSDKLFANLNQRLGNGWELKVDVSYLESERKRASGDLSIYRAIDGQTGASTIDIRENPAKGTNKAVDVHLKGPFSAFGRTHEAVMGANYNHYRYSVYTNSAVAGGVDRRPLNFYELQNFAAPAAFPFPLYSPVRRSRKRSMHRPV